MPQKTMFPSWEYGDLSWAQHQMMLCREVLRNRLSYFRYVRVGFGKYHWQRWSKEAQVWVSISVDRLPDNTDWQTLSIPEVRRIGMIVAPVRPFYVRCQKCGERQPVLT